MADYSLCVGMASPSRIHHTQQLTQHPNRFFPETVDPFEFQRGRYTPGFFPGALGAAIPGYFPYNSPLNPIIPGLLPNGVLNGPSAWVAPLFGVLSYVWALLSGAGTVERPPGVMPPPLQPAIPQNIRDFLQGKVTRTIPPFSVEELATLNPTKDAVLTQALSAINQDQAGRLALEQMFENHYIIRRDAIEEDGVAGYTDPKAHEVVINTSLQTADRLLSTIGHELIHVIPDLPGDRKDSQREEAFSEAFGEALAARILKQDPLMAVSVERLAEIQQLAQANYQELPPNSNIQDSIRATGIVV